MTKIIESIMFNDGTELEVGSGEIIVFVGANNVGKSQCLRDIYGLCKDFSNSTTVIASMKLHKPDKDQLDALLETHCRVEESGDGKKYHAYNFHGSTWDRNRFLQISSLGALRPFFVSYLRTDDRLQLANPAELVNKKDQWKHPIHYVAFNHFYRAKLSDYFNRAFGTYLIPHLMQGKTIPLCIGEKIVMPQGGYRDEEDRLEAYATILDTYDQVQDQGDGMRSFVGIALNLMLDNYKVILLDEPESFLHPPQARIIGEIIGEMSGSDRQVFVSTHSKDVVQGLIETCPDKVKLVRIAREGDANQFFILDNKKVASIWNDSLLRHSNIMDAMFHESVVLCESDSDCRMYSIILESLKNEEGKYVQTHFIHSGGKHRMANVAEVLQSLGSNYRIVPDLDILNDKEVFKRLISSCGGDWASILKDYDILVSRINQLGIKVNRQEVQAVLGKTQDPLTSNDLKKLRDCLSADSPWRAIKKGGKRVLPRGDGASSFEVLDGYMRGCGIYLVPVGEIESFIPSVGNHGPRWVDEVLERYPDVSAEQYAEIRDFVKSWEL